MIASGATPRLAPRTISNVFIYNITSSALSVSRLSYAAFHNLSDVEMVGVDCFVNSVAVNLYWGSPGSSGVEDRSAAVGW